MANQKIDDLPAGFAGVFVLEVFLSSKSFSLAVRAACGNLTFFEFGISHSHFFDIGFLVQETYYTNVSTGVTAPSPFLFLFTAVVDGVQIASYTLPPRIAPGDLRNNNTALRFDFAELVRSPTFAPAVYAFDAATQAFALNATTVLSPTRSFVLIESVASYQIRTLEQVWIDGHNVMPFSTPIVYDRR